MAFDSKTHARTSRRLPTETLAGINAAGETRAGFVSPNSWINEAGLEKPAHERRGASSKRTGRHA